MKMTNKFLLTALGLLFAAGASATKTAEVVVLKEGTYNGFHGTALTINGEYKGHMLPDTFVKTKVPAGEVELVSRSETTPSISFEAEAGETYYVLKSSGKGVHYVRTGLTLVDSELAKAVIENNERLQ